MQTILRVYQQALPDEIEQGKCWYHIAHNAAKSLGVSVECGAGVIAALSPGLKWEVNVEAARRVIQGESLKGLGVRWKDAINKAQKIANGANPLDVLRGNKVRAFYQCILNPDTCCHVCVDGHAYSIWKGKRIPTDQTPQIGNPLYRKISNAYVKAANALSLKPHELQAITWLVWRRLYVK